jgi:2-keto-4-pentenoate hydratase
MIVDHGGPVDRSSLIHPRAEPEIAFLTAPVPLEPGTAITAEFDGLGSVEVYCR